VLRGPFAREVAPQHMPWYDRGYRGEPRGGNEAEQAAWDRGALDRSNADRAANRLTTDEPAPAKARPSSREDPNAAKSALDTIMREFSQPEPLPQAATAEPGPKPPAREPITVSSLPHEDGGFFLARNDNDQPVGGRYQTRKAADAAKQSIEKKLNAVTPRTARIREMAARAEQIAAERQGQEEPAAPVPNTSAPRSAAAEAEAADPGGTPRSLSASASDPNAQSAAAPPAPPSLSERARAAADKLFGFGRKVGADIQMKVAPMSTGDRDSMAAATDFANLRRAIDHERMVADTKIEKQFDPEARKRMWDAADEESVMRQRGETSEHMGIATLTPEERALTDSFQPEAQAGFARMRELGMVQGEGLPYWTPRMLANAIETGDAGPRTLDRMGANLRTTTPQAKHRKYEFAEDTEAAMKKHFGEEAGIARDIRVMPLAIAKMKHAIAGREFVNKIREISKAAGLPDAVGNKPGQGWFTIDHPAMYETRVRPRMEEADTATYRGKVEEHGIVKVSPDKVPLVDRNGDPVLDYERVPIWLPNQMEGPLRAVLTKPPGLTYTKLMELKGKTMGLVMNSPLIHNAVILGKALPAAPTKVIGLYFRGNRAKNDPAIMSQGIREGGVVPFGKRGFNQDVNAIMEEPNLTPGRSWTSQVLGFVPGLFDPKAGVAVKRAIDRAGDFWHNTMLWDRIGDLQMGLYLHFQETLMADHGLDRLSASRVAGHLANRYTGAIPQEAMSDAARKFANMLLFSRSFTLGNLGIMKDMFNGLPRNVRAQVERDVGSLDPKAAGYIKSLAQRKAISVVMLDMGLMFLRNSLLQSGLNVMRGDK